MTALVRIGRIFGTAFAKRPRSSSRWCMDGLRCASIPGEFGGPSRFGMTVPVECHYYSNSSAVLKLTTSKASTTNGITAENERTRRFGGRLRDLLNNEKDLAVYWKHSRAVLRESLQELRILRAKKANPNTTFALRQELILDCLVLLDKLSESLPRAEDYSSSWLSSSNGGGSLSSSSSSSLEEGGFVLDQSLWNEFLKEWMMAWKNVQQQQELQNHHNHKLPTPSQMAEKVDSYRSRCLVIPDPTSYNMLLNAMIHSSNGGNNNTNNRIKAIKLADDYLCRLLRAQEKSFLIDTVSVTTVMKGWVDLGQPQKAQEWLQTMEAATAEIAPNAVAYSTLIHGWAKKGKAHEAEAILERALEFASKQQQNDHCSNSSSSSSSSSRTPFLDRLVFHTVLDAWAAKASRNGSSNSNKTHQHAVPSLRAKALVQKMHQLADEWVGEALRPNDETWHKLIAIVASSQEDSEEVGPRAAEALLVEFEKNNTHDATPAVLLNRILQAYCASCGMEEAEAFFHRRVREREANNANTTTAFPNEVTFHTILSGWANAARVAGKTKKKSKQTKGIPLRAQAWLETMQEHNTNNTNNICKPPSTRAYGSVLQAWSLSTNFHKDAADRAEDLLRNHVWSMLQDDRNDPDLARGVVICTNIGLRAWSNQAASSSSSSSTSSAVKRCLSLLRDFLEVVENNTKIKPTEETFRAVLHAICTPSRSMTPLQKHNHAKALLACMKKGFRLQPSKSDLAKFERLKQRKDAYLAKQQRTN